MASKGILMEGLIFSVYLLEGVAAVSGFYYLGKKPDTATRFFVYFLLFTFIIETIGHIPIIIHRNEALYLLKDTFLVQNYWLYNLYHIISFLVYINYFKWKIKRKSLIKTLNIVSILYLITTVANLIFSDVFFVTFSAYTYIIGTILIFISIAFYYYEILLSNKILSINREVSFYISVAALLFHLTTTPFFIYFKYFNTSISPEFVNLYGIVFMVANIFMYSCFTIGFLICSQKKNSYS